MEKLYHPNLVELKEVIDDPDCKSLYLVIEYMSKGPILPDTPKCNPVDEEVAWHYFREVLKGVVYMHSQV
jgi:serine/threonine protein kinase